MMAQQQNPTKSKFFHRAKPFFAVIFLQFGLAGMDILSKAALNEGMSNYVFVVYRHAIATIVFAPFAYFLEKKTRPKMTVSIFIKLMLLSILEPVIDQNLYILGMKNTTATFAAAMCNILPAITFVMACIFKLENIRINSTHSQAKIIGTITTIVGAMLMTIVKGPVIHLFWTKASSNHIKGNIVDLQHSMKGAIMITVGCFSWASFMILQAVTLNTYPAELSLTAWICFLGATNGSIVALVMEKGNPAAWAVQWDTKFLAAFYSGIVCSGLAYYIQGIVMKVRGPVFVTAFNPLSMVIVAIMSTIILAEQMYMGRVIGAVVIVGGLYLVIWGKSKDYKSSDQLVDEEMPSCKHVAYGNKSVEEATHDEIPNKETGREEQQIYDAKKSILV